MKINVVKIQRFSTHDGPGIRTVVFTKGCPLHCEWCHNPETQSPMPQVFYNPFRCIGCKQCEALCSVGAHRFEPSGEHVFDRIRCIGCQSCADGCVTGAMEAVGQWKEIDEILEVVRKDRDFYGDTGGITLSGGEPMMQPQASLTLLAEAKRQGFSTALETCGYFDSRYIEQLAEATDYFLWDFKDGADWRHRQYTGVSHRRICENLLKVDSAAKHILLRCILVEGVNTDSFHLESIQKIYHQLVHCDGIELIPYHPYGESKKNQLGCSEKEHLDWVPSADRIKQFQEDLRRFGCVVVS